LAQFLWQGLWFILLYFDSLAADLLVGKYQRIVSEPNLTTGNMQRCNIATLQLCGIATLLHCNSATAIVTRSA